MALFVPFSVTEISGELRASGKHIWMGCLVGQFLGANPKLTIITAMANKLWGRDGNTEEFHDNGLYYFEFQHFHITDWVLEGGPWHINNIPLILRKWSPNIGKLEIDRTYLLISVHLWGLPVELVTKEALSCITSVVGRPICMDKALSSVTEHYMQKCMLSRYL